ncbi:polyphosphate kinase 1 [Peptoniphilus catoniae]|uniref:polyphosphate kinase 1 n=1 Tax=Peptoniphilus catoniae TaxID=1660341 RepID=UPI0010FE0B32|nr:polyphosphate kinase 1 [Peptoniphilus catoniae]
MDFSYTQNRELSWINFNKRVMEEALGESVPLFEKLNFLKIFCSNLDEFFMIRVGGLTDLSLLKDQQTDNKSGLTASEQLQIIFNSMEDLYKKKDKVFETVEAEFRKDGIYNLSTEELTKAQRKAVYKYFKDYIMPVLSPLTIGIQRPFPFLENGCEYLILEMEKNGETKYGIMALPNILPKIIKLTSSTGYPFIRTSKVIYEYAEECYPKSQITAKTIIRVTRNADLSADDEISYDEVDYRSHMKKILKKRKRLQAVRVEVNEKAKDSFETLLCKELNISANQIIQSDAPLSMDYVSELRDYLSDEFINQNSYNNYLPKLGEKFGFTGDLIDKLRKKDYLLSYPYDSMESFLKLIEQASTDDRVVSIKITIYRLAKNSRLVNSLCRAAENGKEVLVIMELRARFDEQSNLDYSKQLFDSGCNIIYGMAGYKVHSKICLITLKDEIGWSYITQIGTGNYNEITARGYSDLCLMTSNFEIGKDAVRFFKNLSTGNLDGKYKYLLQSPSTLKSSLLLAMDEEIQKGPDGFIFFKMNSLTDRDFIDKLQEASMAGVKVQLIVRGICCLLPGIEGKTENIEARSIVGRFLEHARVYVLGKNNPKVYIGSADLMTRNTEHRVELLCPILDDKIKDRILKFMDIQFSDNIKGRRFGSDGNLYKIIDDKAKISSQNYFMEEEYKLEESKPEKQSILKSIVSVFKKLFK